VLRPIFRVRRPIFGTPGMTGVGYGPAIPRQDRERRVCPIHSHCRPVRRSLRGQSPPRRSRAPGVPGLFSQTPRAGLAPTPRPHASGVVSTQGPGIKRRLESGGNPVISGPFGPSHCNVRSDAFPRTSQHVRKRCRSRSGAAFAPRPLPSPGAAQADPFDGAVWRVGAALGMPVGPAASIR
jgi:hypothetical protein